MGNRTAHSVTPVLSSSQTATSTSVPKHDTPILDMVKRPRVPIATEYGNPASFWVEYPNGLVDVTRTTHLPKGPLEKGHVVQENAAHDVPLPRLIKETQLDIPVDGDRVVRIASKHSAVVIIDMQK